METGMFQQGDLVTIREEFRNPGETDMVFQVVSVNDVTQRCYITPATCNLPLCPQELVSFAMIKLYPKEEFV